MLRLVAPPREAEAGGGAAEGARAPDDNDCTEVANASTCSFRCRSCPCRNSRLRSTNFCQSIDYIFKLQFSKILILIMKFLQYNDCTEILISVIRMHSDTHRPPHVEFFIKSTQFLRFLLGHRLFLPLQFALLRQVLLFILLNVLVTSLLPVQQRGTR